MLKVAHNCVLVIKSIVHLCSVEAWGGFIAVMSGQWCHGGGGGAATLPGFVFVAIPWVPHWCERVWWLVLMTITKLGVPNRWNWTGMVRGVTGGEAPASYTSVSSVAIPLIGKITWPNTYARTPVKNLSFALIAHTVPAQKTRSITTFAYTRGRSRTPACSAPTAPPTDMLCSSICWSTTSNYRIKTTKPMFVVFAFTTNCGPWSQWICPRSISVGCASQPLRKAFVVVTLRIIDLVDSKILKSNTVCLEIASYIFSSILNK